jgi:hypothetical protein
MHQDHTLSAYMNVIHFVLFFRKYFSIFLLVVLLPLLSCTRSATDVITSWKNPEVNHEGYDHIFVAAFIPDIEAKALVEEQMVALLDSVGIQATTSLSLFPDNFTEEQVEDKGLILDKVRAEGNEAILTISLIDQESEGRFVGGNDTYAPAVAYDYYNNFHTYYAHNYNQIYIPGYYSLDKIYYIETNLYDVEDESLSWSLQSDTYNPEDTESFAGDFSRVIIARLKKDGLLRTE